MSFVFSACGAESLLGVTSSSPRMSPVVSPETPPVTTYLNDPLRTAVEILKDRLYYVAVSETPSRTATRNGKPLHYFQIDTELIYWNFFLDFGPLNLGQLYRFSMKLNSLMNDREKKNHIIVFYSSSDPNKRANAIYLITAWQMLYLNRTPEEAILGFPKQHQSTDSSASVTAIRMTTTNSCNASSPPLAAATMTTLSVPPFHDASPFACHYDLTILDCLRGLIKARNYGFFDFSNFDVEEYEHFEQVENGDLNWIIKDRIVAFAGPHFHRNVSREGYCTLTPADYVPYFKERNVDLVVRLNKRCYNEDEFKANGIRHFEQYYLDGSCPPMAVLDRVIAAFETVPTDMAFAVHCKAGLGRTGTCIGAYMMKHYKFTAAEAIGWMRICRPGMVIGPQQHFLKEIELRMWQQGDMLSLNPTSDVKLVRIRAADDKDNDKGSPKSVVTMHQFVDECDATEEREGQADELLARRNLTRK